MGLEPDTLTSLSSPHQRQYTTTILHHREATEAFIPDTLQIKLKISQSITSIHNGCIRHCPIRHLGCIQRGADHGEW